jgi:hypothetical protein
LVSATGQATSALLLVPYLSILSDLSPGGDRPSPCLELNLRSPGCRCASTGAIVLSALRAGPLARQRRAGRVAWGERAIEGVKSNFEIGRVGQLKMQKWKSRNGQTEQTQTNSTSILRLPLLDFELSHSSDFKITLHTFESAPPQVIGSPESATR